MFFEWAFISQLICSKLNKILLFSEVDPIKTSILQMRKQAIVSFIVYPKSHTQQWENAGILNDFFPFYCIRAIFPFFKLLLLIDYSYFSIFSSLCFRQIFLSNLHGVLIYWTHLFPFCWSWTLLCMPLATLTRLAQSSSVTEGSGRRGFHGKPG